MSVTVPASPFTPADRHALPHPRAGSRLVLDTADPRLAGHAVTVQDWYDRVYRRPWKAAALGGDPLVTTYADRLARLGLPDTPHAVVVQWRGAPLLVHASELVADPQE